MPNIVLYLDRMDSIEVTFDYVTDYVAKHDQPNSPSEWQLSDEDYEDFKKKVVKSGFTYDRMTEKKLDELMEMARFEGYYDESKEEFELLKKKLKHDVARDMERYKEQIKKMLEGDIIVSWFYQRGAYEASIKDDKVLKEALKFLKDEKAYRQLLRGKENKK